MRTLARYEVWYGRDEPPVETHELRAGPVTALLEGPDLRHVRLGANELAQRIYMAVRDEGWNTIPGTYSDVQLDIGEDRFQVGFTGRHRYQEIDYEWTAAIVGAPDGTISYAMDGIAKSAFRYAKIGFNVHHPLPETVGQPYRARTPKGEITGTLPELIYPQLIENGTLTAMFAPYDSLTVTLKGGVEARFDFEGDLFEMQDHRNWTDANYKSYGTPLLVPYPMDARPGQRFHQKVIVSVAKAPAKPVERPTELRVELGRPLGRGLPAVGVGMATHGGSLSPREANLLRTLSFDHVRADLHLKDPSYPEELKRAAETCRAIGAGLELALFLTRNAEEELTRFAALIRGATTESDASSVPIKHVLVLEEAEGFSTFRTMTPGHLVQLARTRLQNDMPGAVFAGGTDQFFTELNRDWSQVEAADAIVYSLNPQVHACDDSSLIENLQGQVDTVKSTRHFSGDRPIFISPVTFIGRTGPFPAGPPEPGGLPGQVDVRQASLFGAAWTMGSIKYLSEVGVGSITFYETTGWRGIIETEAGSPMPDRFPSTPGAVFPMYHVFADVAEWKGGELVEARSNDPLAVDAFATRVGDVLHVLVANTSWKPQTVEVRGVEADQVKIRRLDEETAALATSDPASFRQPLESRAGNDGSIRLELLPYAVVRIDVEREAVARPSVADQSR